MKKSIAIAAILSAGTAAFLAYGLVATCWFHDHSYMKASPALMNYVDSMELEWYLEEGYAGRLFADQRLGRALEGHTVDCDISALVDGKNLFQRGQQDIATAVFGCRKESSNSLPLDVGWSGSDSIREYAESGKDVNLIAVVRIKNATGETVYHGFLRSDSLKLARQDAADHPDAVPDSISEGKGQT